MAEQGLDFEVVPVDIYADGPVTANRYGRRLFTPELAATYGYHPAATDRFDRAEAQRIFEHRYSTEEADAIDACRQGSLEELPRLAASLTDALSFSINAGADQRVQQAASRWRNCMSDRGIEDLPVDPSEMPPAARAEEWGLDDANPSSQTPYPAEVEMATADAACRADSGYTQALYDVEWELETELLRENFGELGQEQATWRTLESRIEAIVHQHERS